MKKCIHCGKEIPDEAEFCGFCGTRQPESENKAESETEKTEIIPTVESDNAGNETKAEPENTAVEETQKQEEPQPSDETDAEIPAEDKEPDSSVVTEPVEEKAEAEEPVDNTDAAQQDEASAPESSSDEETSSEDSEIKDAEIVEPASEEKSSDESEEEKQEEPSEPEKETAEEGKPEPVENTETSSEEESSSENSEIKDAEIVEPASQEKTSDQKEEKQKDPFKTKAEEKTEEKAEKKHAEKKKPHVTMPKINLPKIHVSSKDLDAIGKLLKSPDQRVGISNTLAWLILLFALIANWVAFGSFSSGFCTLVIVLIGLVLVNWLTDKEHVTFTATVRNSAEIILAPSVLVLIGGLFIRNIRAGAEIYAFHSIFTTAFIGLFFLSAALILMIITVLRRYEMKIWHVVWIMTIFLALLFWYLITSGMFALIS